MSVYKKSGFVALFVMFLSFGGSIMASAQSSAEKRGELTWYTNVMEARELSEKTKKPIFAFFTGSDWCGWCHKLQRTVFAKKEFIDWAKKNVILLELDFPRGKAQSAELQQQNAELQQVFQVRGYPTIWMFYLTKDDATQKLNVNALGNLGYPQGAEVGKEEVKFLQDANALLAAGNKK